jgi:dihydrofolate reductase
VARRVVASLYVTLDGYLDEPGQWAFPFWSEQAAEYKAAELGAADALLLGRKTYEGFAAVWPGMEAQTGDFGVRMNSLPKHVASRTLTSATWNATIIEGDVAEAVRRLKAEGTGDLLIGGSGTLVTYLSNAGLIDEYRFLVHPIILGNGHLRLFEGAARTNLRLTATRELPNGVVLLTYVPAES